MGVSGFCVDRTVSALLSSQQMWKRLVDSLQCFLNSLSYMSVMCGVWRSAAAHLWRSEANL